MDQETKNSLVAVISYLYKTEREHYEEAYAKDNADGHIFTHVLKVGEWLKANKREPDFIVPEEYRDGFDGS